MKMSSRYHRLLIYDVKRTTKIDGMGPFKFQSRYDENNIGIVPTVMMDSNTGLLIRVRLRHRQLEIVL